MLYDIINPSDAATFHAPDQQIAALTMFLLSNGTFGADAVGADGEDNVPIFVMGGALEWWDTHFDLSIPDTIAKRSSELADALDSIILGSAQARKSYDEKCSSLQEGDEIATFHKSWQDKHRSSMNNFTESGTQIAANIREKFPENMTASNAP